MNEKNQTHRALNAFGYISTLSTTHNVLCFNMCVAFVSNHSWLIFFNAICRCGDFSFRTFVEAKSC